MIRTVIIDWDVLIRKSPDNEKPEMSPLVFLKDGAEELLRFLKAYHLNTILITSQSERQTWYELKNSVVDRYISEVIYHGNNDSRKLSGDIKSKACRKEDVTVEECLILTSDEEKIADFLTDGFRIFFIPSGKLPPEKYWTKFACMRYSLPEVIPYLIAAAGSASEMSRDILA